MTILENYLKSSRVQKALNTHPGDEGFSLIELVVVIAVLAILSAVAIPNFIGVQGNARASAVQNGLVNGIKECVVVETDGKLPSFTAAKSFATSDAFRGFIIQPTTSPAPTPANPAATTTNNSCFEAEAVSNPPGQNADFTIKLDATGVTIKTCSDDTLPGCRPDPNGVLSGIW